MLFRSLEKNGYGVEKIDGAAISSLAWAGEKVETIVLGVSEDLKEAIYIVYYEDKAAANDAWDDIEKYVDEVNENQEDNEVVCKKSGSMIYFGTKAAIKAAK